MSDYLLEEDEQFLNYKDAFIINKPQVIIYSEITLLRNLISNMISDDSQIELLAKAGNKHELIDNVYENEPDICIIEDIGKNDLNIIHMLHLLKQKKPYMYVVLIINDIDNEKEFIAVKNGVKGILYDGFTSEELIACIKSISQGHYWVRKIILERLVKELWMVCKFQNCDCLNSKPEFTNRELEVIRYTNKGLKNREISEILFISEKTVKHHLTKLFKKLNIKRRGQLKQYFIM